MPEAKKSLVTKLAEVMGEMRHVKKEGFNKAQNYAFVRETDVAEKASSLLAERSVWIYQSVVSSSLVDLYTTASGATMRLAMVEMDFQFIDGETGEATPAQRFVGHGADTGDKGIYKAMTGAEKYFLMKTFLVSTGDDPEADEKVDKEVAKVGVTQGARVSKSAHTGERGGKSTMATDAQVNEIARATRELGLDPEEVVTVAATLTGVKRTENVSVRQYLGGLTSEQAGQVIVGLSDFKGKTSEQDDDSVI